MGWLMIHVRWMTSLAWQSHVGVVDSHWIISCSICIRRATGGYSNSYDIFEIHNVVDHIFGTSSLYFILSSGYIYLFINWYFAPYSKMFLCGHNALLKPPIPPPLRETWVLKLFWDSEGFFKKILLLNNISVFSAENKELTCSDHVTNYIIILRTYTFNRLLTCFPSKSLQPNACYTHAENCVIKILSIVILHKQNKKHAHTHSIYIFSIVQVIKRNIIAPISVKYWLSSTECYTCRLLKEPQLNIYFPYILRVASQNI